MKNGYIKTAAATPYITVADCNANGNEIIRLIHEMEKEHVKVMVCPELCITGYTCQDLFLQRRLLDLSLIHISESEVFQYSDPVAKWSVFRLYIPYPS